MVTVPVNFPQAGQSPSSGGRPSFRRLPSNRRLNDSHLRVADCDYLAGTYIPATLMPRATEVFLYLSRGPAYYQHLRSLEPILAA